jgi:hypothetical protein
MVAKTVIKFPPKQEGASFNLDAVKATVGDRNRQMNRESPVAGLSLLLAIRFTARPCRCFGPTLNVDPRAPMIAASAPLLNGCSTQR